MFRTARLQPSPAPALTLLALALLLTDTACAGSRFLDRLPEDEVIYVVMPDRFENGDPANDRGGLEGDRSKTGFDPTHKAFYHGGDLKGVLKRLDYIQNLGVTALWLTPVFTNKSVQGEGAQQSAGYHGYWPLNFLDVDPHLGTREDYRALVDSAHARGLKVYLDIVINHTADVIQYRECSGASCPFRGRADYPYSRRGGLSGPEINSGFAGDGPQAQTAANFARLTRADYAYTPFIPEAELNAKTPAWLNDLTAYHNRGESLFKGESSYFGDFIGLDDVMTENPRVLSGFIEVYGRWIDDFGVDGFRIDTARHVNPEFWQAFVPAMLARAQRKGIANFHIFGEVMEFDPGTLARFTHVDRLPAVNDFALQRAITAVTAKGAPTQELANVFAADPLYRGGEATARRLVTLVGNHDVLRLGRTLRSEDPTADNDELLRRAILAYAMLMHSRGIPALYYGDEQGFTGEGVSDQDSREDMFPSRVASYNDNRLIGTSATTSDWNFNVEHPLYRAIADMARTRSLDPALRRGAQVTRIASESTGLFAFSRLLPGEGETLVAFNTSKIPLSAQILVENASVRWRAIHGSCIPKASVPGSYRIEVGSLSYIVCKAEIS
jgi:glycosidase